MTRMSATHTASTDNSTLRVLEALGRIDAGSSLTLPVQLVVDALLDARMVAESMDLQAAIDRELTEISARPSLVRAEEATAMVARLTRLTGPGDGS